MGYRVVTSGSFVTGQVTIYLAIVTNQLQSCYAWLSRYRKGNYLPSYYNKISYRVVTPGSLITGQVTIYLAIVTKLVSVFHLSIYCNIRVTKLFGQVTTNLVIVTIYLAIVTNQLHSCIYLSIVT